MAEWRIERLDRSHERASFACGKPPLDDFIRVLVSQYDKRRLGRTYVAVKVGEKRVRGYYTLAAGSVVFANMPEAASKKLPRHPVPTALMVRLAADQSAQGQGLGETLLTDAFERCLKSAEGLGIHAVEVDAIDDSAKAFYEKYGFVPLLDDPLHLFLPLATIEQAFRKK